MTLEEGRIKFIVLHRYLISVCVYEGERGEGGRERERERERKRRELTSNIYRQSLS